MKIKVQLEFDFPYPDEPKGVLLQNASDLLHEMKLMLLQYKCSALAGVKDESQRVFVEELDRDIAICDNAIKNAKYEIVE